MSLNGAQILIESYDRINDQATKDAIGAMRKGSDGFDGLRKAITPVKPTERTIVARLIVTEEWVEKCEGMVAEEVVRRLGGDVLDWEIVEDSNSPVHTKEWYEFERE